MYLQKCVDLVRFSCKTTSGNWTVVHPEVDLETIPLEIKTDSTIGSGDEVFVEFYRSGGYNVGYVVIRFSSTPQYRIGSCTYSWTNFPVSLTTEVEKVWRITLNRTSGIRLLIHCNNVEVVNFLMSSSTCSNYRSSYSTYWSGTVGKFWFHNEEDTASDYYRAGQSGRTVYTKHKYYIRSRFSKGKFNYCRIIQLLPHNTFKVEKLKTLLHR